MTTAPDLHRTFLRNSARVHTLPILTVLIVPLLALSPLGAPAAAQIIPLSGEFQANEATHICGFNPKVFARPDGGFGVVWGDQILQSVQGRFYDVDGNPETQEVTLLLDPDLVFEDAAQTPDGGFLALWTTLPAQFETEGGGAEQVMARRFASDGVAVGSEFVISSSTSEVGHARVAVDEAGEFVVTWSEGPFGSTSIEARRFASDGSPLGGQFTVAPAGTVEAPEVAKQVDSGEFTVVWNDLTGNVSARSFSSTGSPMGSEFVVNSFTSGTHRNPDIALSTTGEMLVTWSGQTVTSGVHHRTMLARLDSSGNSQSEVQVGDSNTTQDRPALAAGPDLGSFVIGWEQVPGGGVLTADPRAAFNAFFDQQVTSTESGEQGSLAVAIDPAERVTLVWLTDPNDTFCFDVAGVRGQLYRQLAEGDTVGSVHGASQQVAWKYYLFAPTINGVYEIKLSNLSGDADLHVRTGGLPDAASFDCRPFLGGVQEETCLVNFTGAGIYIGVNGFEVGTIDFTLSVGPETPLFADGFESGDTSAWSVTTGN